MLFQREELRVRAVHWTMRGKDVLKVQSTVLTLKITTVLQRKEIWVNKIIFILICLFLVMPVGEVFADMNATITGGQWTGKNVILKDNGTWAFPDVLMNASFDDEHSMSMGNNDIDRNFMAGSQNNILAVAENGKQIILTMMKTWGYKTETDVVVVERRM